MMKRTVIDTPEYPEYRSVKNKVVEILHVSDKLCYKSFPYFLRNNLNDKVNYGFDLNFGELELRQIFTEKCPDYLKI